MKNDPTRTLANARILRQDEWISLCQKVGIRTDASLLDLQQYIDALQHTVVMLDKAMTGEMFGWLETELALRGAAMLVRRDRVTLTWTVLLEGHDRTARATCFVLANAFREALAAWDQAAATT
jgi:hypothetical protein